MWTGFKSCWKRLAPDLLLLTFHLENLAWARLPAIPISGVSSTQSYEPAGLPTRRAKQPN
jgi:hypothetical protein